jgi:hypothetical protein
MPPLAALTGFDTPPAGALEQNIFSSASSFAVFHILGDLRGRAQRELALEFEVVGDLLRAFP